MGIWEANPFLPGVDRLIARRYLLSMKPVLPSIDPINRGGRWYDTPGVYRNKAKCIERGFEVKRHSNGLRRFLDRGSQKSMIYASASVDTSTGAKRTNTRQD